MSSTNLFEARKTAEYCLRSISESVESALAVEETLLACLTEWSEGANEEADIVQLMSAYRAAVSYYPQSDLFLNGLGNLLYRCELIEEAQSCYRQAIKVSPLRLAARENMDNLCSQVVDRWHYRMLNDSKRNTAYKSALLGAINDVSRWQDGRIKVLDIGAGTGLLSMYAAAASDRAQVDACEMSSWMCCIAEDVISSNHLSQRINLINSKSTDLPFIPDINDRYRVCVMEIFDAGVFGEGVIETMSHAWKNLLHPECVVIPESAQVHSCVIESPDIRRENRYLKQNKPGSLKINPDIFCKTGQRNSSKLSRCLKNKKNTNTFQQDIDTTGQQNTNTMCPENGNLSSLENTNVESLQILNTTSQQNTSRQSQQSRSTISQQSTNNISQQNTNTTGQQEASSQYNPHSEKKVTQQSTNCEDSVERNSVEAESSCQPEPYTSEWLNLLPCGYNQLSGVNKILDVHFNSCSEMVELFETGLDKSIDVELSREGVADALVVWFDLHLYDDIHLSTSPLRSSESLVSLCWEQTVYPLNTITEYPSSSEKSSSNSLAVTGKVSTGNKLKFHISVNDALRIVCEETFQDTPSITAGDEGFRNVPMVASNSEGLRNIPRYYLDRATIGELNNEEWTESVVDSFRKLFLRIKTCGESCVENDTEGEGQIDTKIHRVKDIEANIQGGSNRQTKEEVQTGVSDTNVENEDRLNEETVIGSEVLSTGEIKSEGLCTNKTGNCNKAAIVNSHKKTPFLSNTNELLMFNPPSSVITVLQLTSGEVNEQDLENMEEAEVRILHLSQNFSLIPVHSLTIIPEVDLYCVSKSTSSNHRKIYEGILSDCGVDAGANFLYHDGEEGFEELGGGWDVIFVDLVDSSGCLRQHVLEDIALARLTCLSDNGYIVPGKVKVKGQLIHSPTLLHYSSVMDDGSTEPFRVAQQINKFQVRTQRDVDLRSLVYQPLSEELSLFTLNFNSHTNQNNEPTQPCSVHSSDIKPSWDDRAVPKKDRGALSAAEANQSTRNQISNDLPTFSSTNVHTDLYCGGNKPIGDQTANNSSVVPPCVYVGNEAKSPVRTRELHDSNNLQSIQDSIGHISVPTEILYTQNPLSTEQPSFLDVERTTPVIAIDSGCVTALIYWFEIELVEGVLVSTRNSGSDGHWKQAAIILTEENLRVEKNDVLSIRALCNNSHIGVVVNKIKLQGCI